MPTANLLLHPVRSRILRTLLGADELTTAQLRERLPDVSPASMYRHVATLTQAGILEVVRETPVRGTVERSYRVRQDQALVGEDARKAMTKDDHRQAFTVFTGAVMSDFDRYLARDDTDPARENVLYRQGTLQLAGGDFEQFVEEFEALVARYAEAAPEDGGTRHILSVAVVPDASATDGDSGKETRQGTETETGQGTGTGERTRRGSRTDGSGGRS